MRWALACPVLAACGRLGFGAGSADVDAATTQDGHVISAPMFSTTSTEFVDIPGAELTIPVSPGKRWLLVTSALLASSISAGVNVEARYLVDGVERGIGGTQVTGGMGPWQHFYVLDGGGAEQRVTYQLRDASAGTASIDQLRAFATPLPTDAQYASSDDIATVTTPLLEPHTTLSLGALRGQYLVLVVASSSDLPDLSDVYVEWRGPAGEIIVPAAQHPREPWQSVFGVRVLAIDGNATITLHSRVSGGTSQLRYIRAVAIPTAAFASLDHALTTTIVDTQSPAPTIANELVPVGEAASYLYLATAFVEEGCTSSPDAARGVHFFVGDEDRALTHLTDNCAFQATYGAADLLTERPSRLAIGVSSGNAEHVYLRESQLVLLGIP